MVGKGYEFFGKAVNTVIYKRKNWSRVHMKKMLCKYYAYTTSSSL
jgi:hypothetical protein